jgi:hypothetical protein
MSLEKSSNPRARQLAQIKQMQELARSRYPEPTSVEPSQGDIAAWCDATPQVAMATDGCRVELDGICSHGYPSWLIMYCSEDRYSSGPDYSKPHASS